MNQIHIVNNQEYVIIDRNFQIIDSSTAVSKYAALPEKIKPGQDIRLSFPELIGLEATCELIYNQQQDNFTLKAIARNQADNQVIYFDIYLEKIENYLVLLCKDVTELMVLKQSLMQKVNEAELALSSLKRFENCTNRIIGSMGELLIITNASGIIERVNRAAKTILGYGKSDFVGNHLSFVVNDPKFDFTQIYRSLLKENNTLVKYEFTCEKAQGELVEIEFNCFVVPTEVKDVLNCVYIGRDITIRKQAEAEIRQALEKEKELTQLKSRFISMASHEFRNPLSSILISADALADSQNNISTEDFNFYVKFIQKAALNMNSLLEDVLLISRQEAGKQSFKPEKFNLAEFSQQIIHEISLTYPDRKVDLTLEGDLSNFSGDEKLLWHILTNILCNALKYSPTKSIVDFTISQSKDQVIIEIRDRGIGISPETQKHIFESFYRGNNVNDIPGSGLGLAIVKRAVDLHQGQIIITSEPNLGSTVKVIL
ncbi:PAS domain-containing sensor histidine kinase [Xenococcus sp. PCC 7305]|uniref:PAS domain-containing sensor histidine kinase n=1 Tax=Xenococcus sp. PCC 7305 TaxID=102125 RepID=UPI0005934E59|nr:PAS domain-containing sensor histidine kinase [Xenococcus sp. PCC 7305]